MNDAQHTAVQAYVRDLADRLLLADWEVRVFREPSADSEYASIQVLDVENYATIRVCTYFFEREPTDQREWLVHELVHCHLDRLQRVMEQLASQFSDNTATQFAKALHRKEVEVCTQRFARLLMPNLPLPDLPSGVNY